MSTRAYVIQTIKEILESALTPYQLRSEKGNANGYAGLNAAGRMNGASSTPIASGTSTGTGAPQVIPHGLGVIPRSVVITPLVALGFTSTNPSFDATNFTVTVANTIAYKWDAYG